MLRSRRPRTSATIQPPLSASPPARLEPRGGRPLRVAIVTEFYYPHLGGICEHVHYFAREARRLGHRVDIVTSNIEGAVPEPGVIRLGRSQPIYFNGAQARLTLGIGLGREMKQIFRRGQYDIVHVHSPLNPTLPLLAIDNAECPVVGTFHTYFDKSHLFAMARRPLQKKLDRMSAAIAVSESTTRALERYFDADWKIIPNGIDLDVFDPGAPPPRGIREDVPAILFLGRFDPRNGLVTLLEAFRKIRSDSREAQLVVVGDGPLRSYYRGAAGDLKDITFTGAVTRDRPRYYAHASMYACPTIKASFGITLLESMSCETPVVCSDIPGFRDVVKHEREALMFPCGDVDALADHIVRLLGDEPLRRRLGRAGREVAAKYSWQRVTAMVLDVYKSVLGAPAADRC